MTSQNGVLPCTASQGKRTPRGQPAWAPEMFDDKCSGERARFLHDTSRRRVGLGLLFDFR